MKLLILSSLIGLLLSCGRSSSTSKSSEERQDVSAIYASSLVDVKIYYEPRADPYVLGPAEFRYWDILQQTLEALFQGRSPAITVNVPKELSQMTAMSSFNKTTWSIEDVKSMAQTVPVASAPGTSTFQLFFVNGVYTKSPNVIGFHISGTKIMVIFKDVIKRNQDETSFVSKYLEQATLVHELAHALGLVNNGLPMKVDHHDASHKAHCTNSSCVMYYANEGTSSMVNFLAKVLTTSNYVMFDDNCLNDARSF